MKYPVKITLSFTVEPRHNALLDKWASEEDRSRSAVLRRLIDNEAQRREVEATRAGTK